MGDVIFAAFMTCLLVLFIHQQIVRERAAVTQKSKTNPIAPHEVNKGSTIAAYPTCDRDHGMQVWAPTHTYEDERFSWWVARSLYEFRTFDGRAHEIVAPPLAHVPAYVDELRTEGFGTGHIPYIERRTRLELVATLVALAMNRRVGGQVSLDEIKKASALVVIVLARTGAFGPIDDDEIRAYSRAYVATEGERT